jgi:vancomycin resistance protein YoaR
MTQRVKSKKKKPSRRWLVLTISIGSALIFIIGALGLYLWSYQSKILPHISVGDAALGSRTATEARKLVSDKAQLIDSDKVKIQIDDMAFEETPGNLGITYDIEQSVARASRVGHTNHLTRDLWDHLRTLFGPVRLAPVTNDYENRLADWIANIATRVDEKPQEANLEIKDGQASIVDPKSGHQIDQAKIVQDLNKLILTFKPPQITGAKQETQPRISRATAESLAANAIELVKNPLKLSIGGQKFTVKPNQLGKWLELKVRDSPKSAGHGLGATVAQAKEPEAYVSFNADKVRAYLETLGPQVNKEPKDAKFSLSNGKITVYQASAPGAVLNATKTTENVIQTLENKDASREMKIDLEEKKPTLDESVVENITKYGIKELIASASTSFVKSPSNRIHNIENGANYLNGILIKPGAEFSTISYLGNIDGSTGYLQELVIKENRTIPEFGGGLCQVSTTLFRAAMNAGLKITERQNHSYRVSYYEPPIGMDATIYSPKPDLKFVNNTPAYILIQSHVQGTTITFDFYGTKDGRRIEIGTPQEYDSTPPGEPIYVVDPNMAPGEVRQIEKAHAGAKASFTYKVFDKNGSSLVDQTFKSAYVPWPAKFLKGPDAPPAETPPAEATPPAAA